MTAPARVRRLELRVPTRSEAGPAREHLTDALRICSLPGLPPRALVIVRRLELAWPADARSSRAAAAAIERAWLALRHGLVHGEAPAAATADAVWFASPAAAVGALARRLAARRAVDAWFWPRAVPSWHTGVATRRWLATMLADAGAPSAPATTVEAGAAALAATVDVGATALAAAACNDAARRGGLDRSIEAAAVCPVAPPPEARGELRGLEAAGCTPAGLALAARLLAAAPAHREPPATAAPSTSTPFAPPAARGDVSPSEVDPRAGAAAPPRIVATSNAPEMPRPVASPPTPPTSPSPPSARTRPGETAASPGVMDAPATLEGLWLATPNGGVVLLVQALRRLGLDALGARDALAARAVLALVSRNLLDRVRAHPEDPARRLFADAEADTVSSASLPAPPDLHQRLGRVPVGAPARWRLALARHLRRRAGTGPAALVHRPARCALDRTHLDVLFPLASADLALRRAGLDLDPGWVPWLGRVVRLHYGG